MELLVASVIGLIIVAATLSSFTYQHQTYVVVDQVSEAQQNTRAIASLLERDVRNAGYLVNPSGATCGIDKDDEPDTIYLSDASVIRPPDELGATLASKDLGAEITSVIAGSPDVVRVDDLVIDGQATYDTNADGTADSDFQIGGGAILIDAANTDRGALCGTITAISLSSPQSVSLELSPTATFSGTPSNPPDFVLIPAHVYDVTGSDPPVLRRDGQVLAKDVEDLQIAWFLDADEDDELDAGEYRGASGTTYDPKAQDGALLREVRVNVVLRTRGEDPRNPDSAGRGQETENRDTAVAGADGRRRRVHTATVRVRNVPAS